METRYLIVLTFEVRNFACLRDYRDMLIWFIRSPLGLLIYILGGDVSFVIDYFAGLDLVLTILLLSFGSSIYLVILSDSRHEFLRNLRVRGYPYSSCREVVIASTGYHLCFLSQ